MEEEKTSEALPTAVEWTASEFIAHDKSAAWYLGLAAVAAILSFVIYMITKDYISVAVVIVAALLMGVYGARQPRQLQYKLDLRGVTIGGKFYPYADFRSFSVVPEGAFASIVFMPLKRFGPPVTIYFAPDDQQKIMAILGRELPFEEPRRDVIDTLLRKIRF